MKLAKHCTLIVFVIALCVMPAATAHLWLPKSHASRPLVITHLAGDYYAFTTYRPIDNQPFPSNGMYCVTDSGVVMFDTPWDTTQMQPLLDSVTIRHGKKVVLCIATHFHDDRTAGLAYLNKMGIKTYSSKKTFDLCAINHEKQAAFCFLNDTTFVVGNHVFETYYPGEGHSKDNIVVWCRDAKILYGGCLVKSCESSGLGNVADANLSEWAQSIQKVIKRYPNPKYSIPGHFGWHIGNELTHTLNLLKHK